MDLSRLVIRAQSRLNQLDSWLDDRLMRSYAKQDSYVELCRQLQEIRGMDKSERFDNRRQEVILEDELEKRNGGHVPTRESVKAIAEWAQAQIKAKQSESEQDGGGDVASS